MTLLDHFHPPLNVRRHQHSFHNAWATALAGVLNQHLPDDHFAEPNVTFGIEIDVATLEESASQAIVSSSVAAVPQPICKSPQPTHSIPFSPNAETIEVNIFSTSGWLTLVGAIELVSPANKDRQEHRQAFVSKCEAYLHQGIGLVVVDIVTERRANLHNELLSRLNANTPPMATHLYGTAYRLVELDKQVCLDIRQEALIPGQSLPSLPLWLHDNLCLPVELASTDESTCRQLKIPVSESASFELND